MNISLLNSILTKWIKDCKAQGLDEHKIKLYITRSSGDIIFGMIDENQNILDYVKWSDCL